MTNFSSKLLEDAVNEFSRLPGIGRKSALRMVLYLLRNDKLSVERFGNSIIKLRNEITYCKNCHNISETELCSICSGDKRDHSQICIVENIRDVIAIENTSQYYGVYHVLGGIISPMDGIGPSQLQIESLIKKVASGNVREIIMALSTSMEGDTTVFYIYKKLAPYDVKVTTLARGVSVGSELEYTDEVTLGRSLLNRTPYENIIVK